MAAPRVGGEAPGGPVSFGRYLVFERVAQGRLAGVHRALLRREGKPDEWLALKRFDPALCRDRRFTELTLRVMARAAQVEHAAHCAIAEVDRAEDGSVYAALEWVAGQDLKRIALALRARGEMMPAPLVAYVGMQIAEVLAEAHGLARAGRPAPLLHGELSATDILIGYDGRVKLIGLGSAELTAAAQQPPARPAYLAPEIERGAPCSPQGDVFSLGACLYQVLSFQGAGDAQGTKAGGKRRADSHITQIIPRALKEILGRALAEQPEARWSSAAEFAHELRGWCATQTQPGDAAKLAVFMRVLFTGAHEDEQRRVRALRDALPGAGPWDGPDQHTPAQGVLMEQLAATMADPAAPAAAAPESAKAREPAPADDGGAAIVAAVVNPPEPELPVQGWSEGGWDDEVTPADHPWISPAEERVVIPERRPAPKQPPEQPEPEPPPPHVSMIRPATHREPPPPPPPPPRVLPAPAAPHAPPPQATPLAPAPVPAPALPPAALDPWHSERRHSPLVPAAIALGALALAGAGVFAFRDPAPDPVPEHPATAAPAEPQPAPAPVRTQAPEATPDPNPAAGTEPAVNDSRVRRPPHAKPSTPATAIERSAATTPEPAPPRAYEPPHRREIPGRSDPPPSASPPAPTSLATATSPNGLELAEPPVRAELPAPEPAAPSEPAPTPTPPPLRVTPQPTVPDPAPPTQPTAPVAPVAATSPNPPPPAPAKVAPRGPTRAAVPIHQVAPRFPTRAKRMALDRGVVVVEFTVDERGAVKDARVASADPPHVFDDAALEAIARWTYQPKLVNGEPVASRLRFTFRFR